MNGLPADGAFVFFLEVGFNGFFFKGVSVFVDDGVLEGF